MRQGVSTVAVASLLPDLRPPEEIRYGEVVTFWERRTDRFWAANYALYLSPNKELKAVINENTGEIALMWDWHTGEVNQVNTKALFDLVKVLGGLI